MKDQTDVNIRKILNRPAYAKRSFGCLAGLIGYGIVLGIAFRTIMVTDPFAALQQIYALSILGNVVAGSLFVLFTYRRALDCKFGQNGKAWIATVAALPTLALPQYGLLIFALMMFFKSAPEEEDVSEITTDEFVHPQVQAGE